MAKSDPGEPSVGAGDLLVASVLIDRGIFAQSVVLILDADASGALGVVINKVSNTALGQVLPNWVELTSRPQALFAGGPVSNDGAICLAALASPDEEPPGWRRVFAEIGLLHLDTPTEIVAGGYRDLRIFAGYAGWEPGQLQDEIARGSWHLVPAEYSDVFTENPEQLWRQALRRAPAPAPVYATWPDDPEAN